MQALTPRQARVLRYMMRRLIEDQTLPTLQEIARHIECSPRGAKVNVDVLVKKGYVKAIGPEQSRRLSRQYKILKTPEGEPFRIELK